MNNSNGRGGLFNSGIGCQAVGCCGCLLMLVICFAVVIFIASRPTLVSGEVVKFLNNDQAITYDPVISAEDAQTSIVSQVKSAGENQVYITEAELTAIARARIPQADKITVDVEPGEMKVYWYLDKSVNPIIAEIILTMDSNNKLTIKKIGTPRVELPAALNETVQKLALSLLTQEQESSQITTNEETADILQSLITSNENFQISKAEFEKDRVRVDVFVNIKIL